MGVADAAQKTPQLLHLFGDAFTLAADGLLLFQPSLAGQARSPEPRVVVPACHRQQVFDLYHAHAQSGAHYGYDRMLHSMRQRFFWLNMCKDIKMMCKACDICSQRSQGATHGILHHDAKLIIPKQRLLDHPNMTKTVTP